MNHSQIGRCLGLVFLATALLGCGESKWEISAENKGAASCKVIVSMNKGTGQSTIDLPPGASPVFQEGTVDTLLDSVDVTPQGGQKQTIAVNKTLKPGQRLNIVVQADGTVVTAILPD